MKRLFKYSIPFLFPLAVISCGGSDSSSTSIPEVTPPAPEPPSELAKFSLGLSDAPVDDALAVYIELDSITLINTDESQANPDTVIEIFTNENGEEVETVQVNLLDFQGSEQIRIIDEAQGVELENGVYAMELLVVDEGSYVLLNNDATEYDIKVPSSRLRLGEFTVDSSAEQVGELPAYTVEFDLRKSLVLRGNLNNNNGFIIKPQGVRIVSQAGAIAGSVAPEFTNLGECFVYLYDSEATEYGDMFDSEDEAFEQLEPEVTASAPLATTKVAVDGTYTIGFLSEGSYQVALACGIALDDNIQFDGITIPSAGDITPDVIEVDVDAGESTNVDF